MVADIDQIQALCCWRSGWRSTGSNPSNWRQSFLQKPIFFHGSPSFEPQILESEHCTQCTEQLTKFSIDWLSIQRELKAQTLNKYFQSVKETTKRKTLKIDPKILEEVDLHRWARMKILIDWLLAWYLPNGQWGWLSWQSGHFSHQRSAVRIPTSAKFLLNFVCCQLYWKDENKEKEARSGPLLKKLTYLNVPRYKKVFDGASTKC